MLRTLALLLLLSACTTIDKQVVGWPQDMKITKHELGFWSLQEKCWPHLPTVYKLLGGVAFGCAEYNLYTLTCDIYHLKNPSKVDMEHEESHCKGGDHDGVQQKYFDSWKRG